MIKKWHEAWRFGAIRHLASMFKGVKKEMMREMGGA
jgi:hypothetical protein